MYFWPTQSNLEFHFLCRNILHTTGWFEQSDIVDQLRLQWCIDVCRDYSFTSAQEVIT